MSPIPLAGLKVVDLTRVLAGPLCTQYMGLMGADVVKVESITGGDEMRSWPPFRSNLSGENPTGSPYLSVNHAKRSITVDMKKSEGKEIVLKLVEDADVVIESFSVGVAERLGVGPEDVRKINPKAIYCRITGFGSVGPMKDVKGYDIILQAFTGMVSMIGDPEGSASRIPFSPIDQTTGMHALIGILSALHERHMTGKSRTVEVSLFDSATGLLAYMLQNYWERGTNPRRFGLAHESLCPYEGFETSDRPIMLGIANDTLWKGFCRLIDRPDLETHPRYLTNALRVANREEVLAIVREVMLTRSCDEWCKDLTNIGVPCCPIQQLSELAAHPHTRETGMIFDFDHPEFGAMTAVAQPVKFDGARTSSKKFPPTLGQHNRAVLKQLGYSEEAIDALEDSGVVSKGKAVVAG